MASPPPVEGDCDAAFLGPFCTGTVCDEAVNCETVEDNPRIVGLTLEAPDDPTLQEVREYSLAAVNAIRARTCLPPLELDLCLNAIAEEALAANAGHGYFIEHCMNAERDYGRQCECNWTQENIGASYGTSRTWVDGIHGPLCRMMTEPKGQGHRANIEAPDWVRLGVGVDYGANGATWYHEFGCDASLANCPKR